MGVVFVARQDGLAREVALKLHLGSIGGASGPGGAGADRAADARARERFEREAHAVARLKHPHVIAIHDFGLHGKTPYLVMDLVVGESLEARLERGPLEAAEAVALLLPIVEAVAFAHEQGILHRDLKPANILLDASGRALLTDFGLARDLTDERDRLTRSGQLLGTPYFMAPEVASGMTSAIDARSDVYALGAVLYQVLVGEPPFLADENGLLALIGRIASEEPRPPSRARAGVPAELDAVVLACLEKDPADRYQSARELAQDLARWQGGEAVSASRSSELSRGLRRLRRRGLGVALPVVVILGLSGFLLDRAFLAPARAARASLASELEWQVVALRPALYGLDPRHPLEVTPGELRRRLEDVERAAEQSGVADPAAVEARSYLLVYLRLSEGERGRRKGHLAIQAAPGRPELVLQALDLAHEGDVAGAGRLIAGALALNADPDLARAQLGFEARFEPRRFLAAGPREPSELALGLLPGALRRAYLDLLGPGFGGTREELGLELDQIQAALAGWACAPALPRQALGEALEAIATSYAELPELGTELAFERLARLEEAAWHAQGPLEAPALVRALEASLTPALNRAEGPAAQDSDVDLAFEVERQLCVLDGQTRETRRIRALVARCEVSRRYAASTRQLSPRGLAAGFRHRSGEGPAADERRLEAVLKYGQATLEAYAQVYPRDPLGLALPFLARDPQARAYEGALGLASRLPLVAPDVLLHLRQFTGRKLQIAKLQGAPAARVSALLSQLVAAALAAPELGFGQDWRRWDLVWVESTMRSEPEQGRAAFLAFAQRARAAHASGEIPDPDLAIVLFRLGAVSGPILGDPLVREAARLDPSLEHAAGVQLELWRGAGR